MSPTAVLCFAVADQWLLGPVCFGLRLRTVRTKEKQPLDLAEPIYVFLRVVYGTSDLFWH